MQCDGHLTRIGIRDGMYRRHAWLEMLSFTLLNDPYESMQGLGTIAIAILAQIWAIFHFNPIC